MIPCRWSFATVIWEIATYGILIALIALYIAALNVIFILYTPLIGAKPFSDVAIGASLDPFIQHLKKGNRPPQPTGLSDSM